MQKLTKRLKLWFAIFGDCKDLIILPNISFDLLVDMSTDISWSLHWPRVYVDQHISWVSANILTDTSVEFWSLCRPIYRSGVHKIHMIRPWYLCNRCNVFLSWKYKYVYIFPSLLACYPNSSKATGRSGSSLSQSTTMEISSLVSKDPSDVNQSASTSSQGGIFATTTTQPEQNPPIMGLSLVQKRLGQRTIPTRTCDIIMKS